MTCARCIGAGWRQRRRRAQDHDRQLGHDLRLAQRDHPPGYRGLSGEVLRMAGDIGSGSDVDSPSLHSTLNARRTLPPGSPSGMAADRPPARGRPPVEQLVDHDPRGWRRRVLPAPPRPSPSSTRSPLRLYRPAATTREEASRRSRSSQSPRSRAAGTAPCVRSTLGPTSPGSNAIPTEA